MAPLVKGAIAGCREGGRSPPFVSPCSLSRLAVDVFGAPNHPRDDALKRRRVLRLKVQQAVEQDVQVAVDVSRWRVAFDHLRKQGALIVGTESEGESESIAGCQHHGSFTGAIAGYRIPALGMARADIRIRLLDPRVKRFSAIPKMFIAFLVISPVGSMPNPVRNDATDLDIGCASRMLRRITLRKILFGALLPVLLVIPGRADANAILFTNAGLGDKFEAAATGGLAVTGPGAPSSEPSRDLAAGFVAPTSGRLFSIELALTWSTGVNAGEVFFMSDANGRPDDVLESWRLSNLERFPPFPPFSIDFVDLDSVVRPKIKRGHPYWVAVSTDDDTILHWRVNGIGDTGIAYRHGNGGWGFQDVAATAFRVRKSGGQGGTAPEPSAVILLVLGGCTWAHHARRKRGSLLPDGAVPSPN